MNRGDPDVPWRCDRAVNLLRAACVSLVGVACDCARVYARAWLPSERAVLTAALCVTVNAEGSVFSSNAVHVRRDRNIWPASFRL